MAPTPVTEDYYFILGVKSTASATEIVQAYRRLARELHPDRNAKHDATAAFQKLGRAYETLNDESKRRAYNLIYPTIVKTHPSSQPKPQAPPPPPTSQVYPEIAQLASLQLARADRNAKWNAKKSILDSKIFELQRVVRRLELEIKKLNDITAEENAKDAAWNTWGAWVLSPMYKKPELSEEEKAKKDRERQERRIEQDMKERRLSGRNADMRVEEELLKKGKEELDLENEKGDKLMKVIRDRLQYKEAQDKAEKVRLQREKLAQEFKKQQEEKQKRDRREAEETRKQWEEWYEKENARKAREEENRQKLQKEWEETERVRREREELNRQREQQKREQEASEARKRDQAARRKQKEEAAKAAEAWKEHEVTQWKHEREVADLQEKLEAAQRKLNADRAKVQRKAQEQNHSGWFPQSARHTMFEEVPVATYQASSSTCRHARWWAKVPGRMACPKCSEVWNYLLQCPGCTVKACPKCQNMLKPRGGLHRN